MKKIEVDLLSPTQFDRTMSQLQYFLVFCAFVAGKSSKTQSVKANEMFEDLNYPEHPFDVFSNMSEREIRDLLEKHKIGQYNRLTKCLYDLSRASLNLNTCSCEELEKIPGIGFKTSRFFVVHSRENANYAVLDTHILAWLREYYPSSPKSTPSNLKQYLFWENLFLDKCVEMNKTPSKLDFEIWYERQKTWKI